MMGYHNATGGEGYGNYKCSDKERDALLHFKAYIHKDPRGILSTWANDEEETNDCCKWRGVTCNNQTGHVTKLYLRSGLEGKISPSLLNLSYLNDLDLSGNSFNGTIPMFIGSMTQLRYLDLGWNNFTGTIPPELGNLTNLHGLSLEFLSGCAVKNLDWLSHMSRLEYLHMSRITLSKADNWVNVILSLKKLSSLRFGGCNLSHVVHPYSFSLVNSSSSIVNLYLEVNNLNSSMYDWLLPLTSNRLEVLSIYSNKLDWISKYLGNLCSLTSLFISRNSLSVKFPDFLKNLTGCTSVTLEELVASHNQFTGPLSDDIQNFPSLQYLSFSNNKLNGTISEKVWELPNLRFLFLFSNSLKGGIFENIGKSNIMSVDLSNNSLGGVISKAHMSNMSSVEMIDLSSNNFYGPIPNVPSTVRWLDLSKNQFYGRISFLCQIVDSPLLFLDLSSNSLTGQIPNCLWHFRKLRVLNLGYNKLFKLPTSIGSLINLEALYINNNKFSGELPLSLQNCTNLLFLHLGANRFYGNLPFWIGEKLSSLYALSLTSNNFSGAVPLQLCQLVKLQILDLSINNLYGSIPACLSNITAMVQEEFSAHQIVSYSSSQRFDFSEEIVDRMMLHWQGNVREFSSNLGLVKIINLSRNNLTGKIPDELTDLHKLIALDLSMNTLNGEIPSKIGLMKELQILDLSRNNLSGGLPTEMSQMTLLNYLDVSYNNLSGRIPSSTQLQSFEPSRYTRNDGLCGPPLSKYCHGDEELDVPPLVDQTEVEGEGTDEFERWFCIGGATGFAIGFWTVCSVLLLNHRLRHAFFNYINRLEIWVYVKGSHIYRCILDNPLLSSWKS
ncbi:receptor-like protein EIX1 isoform X1 [Helianthus annuus]|uniref:receptor-like protein EIX1 isoform X1 n=1 Tax=Helianthus annuus TaxID=4232 RepID=UPI001652E240|nr:receptor-like protein EIX1 isoform X1 [Helianthus annuus]KAJ0620189.1 putative non-specific serine/threonine protein kinase [Helianthus annuus]KAJ0778641.1 putative non-specific serine/threonine protein kinase [Helianthus annuus]